MNTFDIISKEYKKTLLLEDITEDATENPVDRMLKKRPDLKDKNMDAVFLKLALLGHADKEDDLADLLEKGTHQVDLQNTVVRGGPLGMGDDIGSEDECEEALVKIVEKLDRIASKTGSGWPVSFRDFTTLVDMKIILMLPLHCTKNEILMANENALIKLLKNGMLSEFTVGEMNVIQIRVLSDVKEMSAEYYASLAESIIKYVNTSNSADDVATTTLLLCDVVKSAMTASDSDAAVLRIFDLTESQSIKEAIMSTYVKLKTKNGKLLDEKSLFSREMLEYLKKTSSMHSVFGLLFFSLPDDIVKQVEDSSKSHAMLMRLLQFIPKNKNRLSESIASELIDKFKEAGAAHICEALARRDDVTPALAMKLLSLKSRYIDEALRSNSKLPKDTKAVVKKNAMQS